MPSAYSDLERPPLPAAQLARALVRPGSLWTNVRVLAETESTNTDAAAAAAQGEPEGLVVVAETQRAGRGRQGRAWVSPPRAGVTFSVLLRPPRSRDQWGWVPLLAGASVARVIDRVAEVPAAVKWPNDVLVGSAGRKVAGLLSEVVADAVVLGVGLNVSTRRDELPRVDATSLVLEGAACTDRTTLLVALLRALADDYRAWCAGGDVRTSYLEVCATTNHPVRVALPGEREVRGEAIDVDLAGRLVIAEPGGRVTAVAAGDVTHVQPGPHT